MNIGDDMLTINQDWDVRKMCATSMLNRMVMILVIMMILVMMMMISTIKMCASMVMMVMMR